MVSDVTVVNLLVAAPAFLVRTVVLYVGESSCDQPAGSMTLLPSNILDWTACSGTDMARCRRAGNLRKEM